MDFNRYIQDRIVEYGKDENDYKLLWYMSDDVRCFEYIRGLIDDKKNDNSLAEQDAKDLIDRVSANEKRYKKLSEWIAQERASSIPTAQYRETYAYIYESEQEVIRTYCLVTILKLLDIQTDLDNLVIEERNHKGNIFTAEDDSTKKTREDGKRKREATKAARLVVDKNIRDKKTALTPEEVEAYDAAYNEKYRELGGEDEKALNPAQRAIDKRNKDNQESEE